MSRCSSLLLLLLSASCHSTAPQGNESVDSLAYLALVYDDTIITQSARTVNFNGQALLPRYHHVTKQKGGRKLSQDIVSTKTVFGLHRNLTMALTVPYVNRRLRRSGSPTLRSQGLGDITLSGKYRYYQNSEVSKTTEAAILLGLELPTGRTDRRDHGMRLAQPLQPGSGSLDTILGTAFTHIDNRLLINADLFWKINAKADNFRFGDTYRFDVGAQYRIYPERYERSDQLTVLLIAELNGSYAEQNRLHSVTQRDSGGLKVLASPGIQVIVSETLLFEASLQLPIIQNLHGDALEQEYGTIIGLRWRF